MNKERKTKNGWFRILIRIVTITVFVIISLAVLMNVVYWGGGMIAAFIGVGAYLVIGIIVLFLIIGDIKVIKWLIEKTSAPKRMK